jgi:staphylococcal nuclease domain-containing protein 1
LSEDVQVNGLLNCYRGVACRYVTVSLAGIKCPGYRKGEDGRDVPEPYADEARFYTEARMLNREVRVALQAVTNNVFLGTVHHPRGNIAELLLKEGMARVVDWSLSVMADGRDQYRAAEAVAKQKRLRVFREYVAPNAAVQGEKQYVAKCVEIVNVETIVVKKADGAYQKLTLASVRQPRARDGEERPKSYYDIPWMYEAREFLRRKLVGHKVNVAIDYVKPASDGYPEKLCATVTIDGVNVAEALVSKGYATVVKYKPGDEMRSSQYDALYSAEQRAIEAKKGVHKDPADWPVMRVVCSSQQPAAQSPLPRALAPCHWLPLTDGAHL